KGLANKSSLIASLGHIYEFVEEPLPKALPQAQVPEAPEGFALAAYPNPFNPSTQIRFEMSEEGFVTLRIYNLQGQLVRELLHETKAAGGHAIRWDGRDDRGVSVTSGVYFIRFESGGRAQTSKLTVMR
ncbi:T9SS C-terminal target domain-containing protein, partial [candidate division KSB1 bacterium]